MQASTGDDRHALSTSRGRCRANPSEPPATSKKPAVGVVSGNPWADVAQLVEQSIRNGKFLSPNPAVFQHIRFTTLPGIAPPCSWPRGSAAPPPPEASLFHDRVAGETRH